MCLALYGITILGIFLGIYGGSLVEANEQSVKARQRKLKKDLVNRIEGNASRANAVAEEQAMEEEKEPSLLKDIWDIVVLETPVILLVVVLGLIIGRNEGWSIVERYVVSCCKYKAFPRSLFSQTYRTVCCQQPLLDSDYRHHRGIRR